MYSCAKLFNHVVSQFFRNVFNNYICENIFISSKQAFFFFIYFIIGVSVYLIDEMFTFFHASINAFHINIYNSKNPPFIFIIKYTNIPIFCNKVVTLLYN